MVCRPLPGKRFFYVCAVIQCLSPDLLLYNKTRKLGIDTEMLKKKKLRIIFVTSKHDF